MVTFEEFKKLDKEIDRINLISWTKMPDDYDLYLKENYNKKQCQQRQKEILSQLYNILPITLVGIARKSSGEEEEYHYLSCPDQNNVVNYNPLTDLTEYLNANIGRRLRITIEVMENECDDCELRFKCWTEKHGKDK
jgi:hypothetical protein